MEVWGTGYNRRAVKNAGLGKGSRGYQNHTIGNGKDWMGGSQRFILGMRQTYSSVDAFARPNCYIYMTSSDKQEGG
jgi:hypothetical protein